MQATSLAQPTLAAERIQFLDVLRGVALLGILLVNLPYLGLRLDLSDDVQLLSAGMSADALVPALIRGLAENKFMTLFSLLFGMGLALQLDRAEARGINPRSFYPRRLLLLALFGLLNGTLLFFGDILLPYAVAGAGVYLLRHQSARTLLVLAAGLLVIGTGLSVVFEGLLIGPVDDPQTVKLGHEIASGSFVEAMFARFLVYVTWLIMSSIIAFNWRIVAMFLIGIVVMRAGWTKASAGHVHRRAMTMGLGVGLLLEGVSLWLHAAPDNAAALRAADVLCHQIGGAFLSAGYAGAIAVWCYSDFGHGLRRMFASAGRMALTNYIGQNLVASLLFCGYGFGLIGTSSRTQLLGITFAIFCVQVVLSTLWLRRFSGGPLELFWRRLTYAGGRATGS